MREGAPHEIEGLPATLVANLSAIGQPFHARPFHAATPSFKHYESETLGACASGAFPAFSITGGACALQCKHCRAAILKPMIATGAPEVFEAKVREMVARQGLRGFLLSGGSNLRNEVAFEPYLPAIARLKADHPALEILVHTALVDQRRAEALAASGVDGTMLDIIGAEETIRDVYRLNRKVADFEDALAALVTTGMRVIPHIVIGLHFGRLLGEDNALAIIARHKTAAAILVVVMPAYADAAFQPVNLSEASAFLGRAREALADRLLLLGCARPHGEARVILDQAAVLAGLDGVAYPSDEALALAEALGRPRVHRHACCGTQGCATTRKAA
jgi:lipoyl synthase